MPKFVIISGAYGGLGKALAKTYAAAGYGLVLLGRDLTKLQALQDSFEPNVNIILAQADVCKLEDSQRIYNEIQTQNIQVSVLINNAGITYINTFDETYSLERYQNLIDTNLNGAVYLSHLFLKDLLKNNGSIINISSVIGYAPVLGRTAYAASKFGMEGFFSVLDAEQNNALHIMMVYPTFIATDIRKDVEGKSKEVNEILTADFVAKKIYTSMTKGKKRLYLGKTARLSRFMYKFFPKIYVHLMRQKISKTIT